MYGSGDDLQHPPGLELEAYKRYQSGSLGPEAPGMFREALKLYDKSLVPVLLNDKWNVFRWCTTRWALKWPRFVCSITDESGEGYRTPTVQDARDIEMWCDPYGPRWNGDFKKWERALDAYEDDKKRDAQHQIDDKIGGIVDKHLRKVRREFSQFIVPKAYYPDTNRPGGMFNANTKWGKEQAMNKRIYG